MMELDKMYLLEQPKNRCTEKHIKKQFPELYKIINNINGNKFTEKLYKYIYKCETPHCPICGKPTPFRNFNKGYSEFCSTSCSYKSPTRMCKIKSTMLEKYGVDNISKLEDIKSKKKSTMLEKYGVEFYNNREQATKTILEKYGVDNISKLEDIKSKKKSTMLEKYGVDNWLKVDGNLDKLKQGCLEKYGVEYALQNKTIRTLALKSKRANFLLNSDDIIKFEDDMWVMRCPHPDCNKCNDRQFTIKQNMYHDRMRCGAETCTKLLPPGANNNSNTTLELFIQSILDEYNISYIKNDRSILKGKELDIYIPDKNIAIECNGVYWHNYFHTYNTNQHFEKWKQCSENNIQLFTIWEDWIRNKPEIVKSVLLSKLGIYKDKTYARKYNIKDISKNKSLVIDFLEQNHIQGKTVFEVALGAYYNNELCAVMTFNHKRGCRGNNITNENEWELSRFCTKLNTNIVGIAGKFISFFQKNYNVDCIYSYSSNDISSGKLYKSMGFNEINEYIPYWYIEPKSLKRYHRTAFTKREIIRKGLASRDEKFTENEIMKKYHFYKIYDSGVKKWTKYI